MHQVFISVFKVLNFILTGFDPTANGLHIGHLVGLRALNIFSQHGFTPYVVLGGATGIIGDPSFKVIARKSIEKTVLENNLNSIESELKKLTSVCEINCKQILNNKEWFQEMNVLNFMHVIGKHIKLSSLLSRSSMKQRQECKDGATFTELSYQVFQAYDFYYLSQQYGCNIQLGGSDQWGNILTGIELSNALSGPKLTGITLKLLSDKNGNKLGKTQGSPIWLSSEKTNIRDFYNFFVNVTDDIVETLLYQLTTCSEESIRLAVAQHTENPKAKIPHHLLAKLVTTDVHGNDACERIVAEIKELFTGTLRSEARFLPNMSLSLKKISETPLLDLFMVTGLFKSKREVKQLAETGDGVKLNNRAVQSVDLKLSFLRYIEQTVGEIPETVIIQRGKKKFFTIRIEDY